MRTSRLVGIAVITVLLVAAVTMTASFPFTNPLVTDPDPVSLAVLAGVAVAVAVAVWLASRSVPRSTAYW